MENREMYNNPPIVDFFNIFSSIIIVCFSVFNAIVFYKKFKQKREKILLVLCTGILSEAIFGLLLFILYAFNIPFPEFNLDDVEPLMAFFTLIYFGFDLGMILFIEYIFNISGNKSMRIIKVILILMFTISSALFSIVLIMTPDYGKRITGILFFINVLILMVFALLLLILISTIIINGLRILNMVEIEPHEETKMKFMIGWAIFLGIAFNIFILIFHYSLYNIIFGLGMLGFIIQ